MNLRSKNKINPNFSMSSMTDIVFLLLIFFMLISTLMSPNTINLILPKSDSTSIDKEEVKVELTENLDLLVDSKKVASMKEKNGIKKLENNLQKKITNKDIGISLRGHKDVKYKHIVKIINLAKNKKWKLVIATKK